MYPLKSEDGFKASSIYLFGVYDPILRHGVNITQDDVCKMYNISKPYLKKWIDIVHNVVNMSMTYEKLYGEQ